MVTTLNARDMAQQRRGYYEELDVGGMDNWQWGEAARRRGGVRVGSVLPTAVRLYAHGHHPSVSTFVGGPIRSKQPGNARPRICYDQAAEHYRIVL